MVPQEILSSLQSFFSGKGGIPFRINAVSSLSGGSINQVYRLKTTHGDFCLKVNDAGRFPGMFEAEARGLRCLQEKGVLRVPEPLFNSSLKEHTFLLLEFIEAGKPRNDLMRLFGRSLARLHRFSAATFGMDYDNYMGALPQSNRPHPRWDAFFISERLEPQVKLAFERGHAIVKPMEALYPRIGSLMPAEKSSLIHGDLWNGNYIVDGDGKAALIDPAVYYGHREADIAMTTLFGGFSSDFYNGYQEEFPMEQGWRERLDLYNLYPLLVHLNLFGSSYLGEILSILKRY